MSRARTGERKRANGMLLACELFQDMLQGLRDGHSVTRYVLEPLRSIEGDDIEFELVVTKVGDERVPRVTPKMVKNLGARDGS